jgi:Ca2+/Na+ antiporter
MMAMMQIVLANTIKGLRIKASSHADRRIGATSEAIDGILTIKMFSMENSVSETVSSLRAMEAGNGGQKLALIRACNFLVSFIVLPLASFATFATVWHEGHAFLMMCKLMFTAVICLTVTNC